MKKYITTPIYYVNDVPHIGHAYTTIVCDTLARYYRLRGYETFFLTGTDEHGQKIQEAAQKRGKTPKEYADEVSAKFKNLWDEFGISYDHYIRTTDDYHQKTVQNAFLKMYKKGDIYKDEYEGNYCVSCESFFPQTQLINGDCCPDCGKKTSVVKEESFFFKLSKYENELLKWYESSDCILPKAKKNEVVNFVKDGLKDLSITRTSFEWGIKLPQELNEPKHVMYVWLDALLNYLSALGYTQNEEKIDFFNEVTHVVGKDILRFHAIYWPAFLLSLDMPLPKLIAAHGWWTRDGEKMSKSKGNVVNPKEVVDAYGIDEFRYFLLREVPFGQDGDFSEDALISRINSELCNDFGNLLNRIIGMSSKYNDYEIDSSNVLKFYSNEIQEANSVAKEALKSLEEFSTTKFIEEVFKILYLANQSIAKYEPWNLIKNDRKDEALALVAMVSNLLCKCSFLLNPLMPNKTAKVADALGFVINADNFKKVIDDGEILNFKAKKCEPLFEKIEEKRMKPVEKIEPKDEKKEQNNIINIDEFKKCVIKVGTILECSNVEGSEKLLKFLIDLGEEKPRQIISGIAKFYNPSDLVGKQVCVLANLKPAKIFKHLSEGMILSSSFGEDDRKLSLVSPISQMPNGSILS